MIRSICFSFWLLSFLGNAVHAQLDGSRWTVSANSLRIQPYTLEFSGDSAILRSKDSTVFEKMSFKSDHGKLTFQKGIGSTECSTEDIALYDFKMVGPNMEIRLVSDPCGQRSGALIGSWSRK